MIKRIMIEIFCQATEDEKKVSAALRNLTDVRFREKKAHGHYGNPIRIYRAEIRQKRQIKQFLQIFEGVAVDQPEKRVDERGRFHLRLDKQKLYRGDVVVSSDGDVIITVKIVTYPLRREKVMEDVHKILGNRSERISK
jgi:RNA binding exosome subunit